MFQSQISRRLQRLAEHELVRDLGRGVYVITNDREAYLNEKYDAEAGVYLEGRRTVTRTCQEYGRQLFRREIRWLAAKNRFYTTSLSISPTAFLPPRPAES